ncbi:MAG: membrane protein insertase YidC [Bacteroidales bacterium]|nr:membrane protein insertase YidC [Bacteroidales bacterium]
MDKKSVIGFVLIFVIMIVFFGYQSRQVKKQQEAEAKAAREQFVADTIKRAQGDTLDVNEAQEAVSQQEAQTAVPSEDASSQAIAPESVARDTVEAQIVTLSNEKLEVRFTTKGAQPYSALIKDYLTYSKDSLFLLQPGKTQLGFTIFAQTAVDTRMMDFQVEETTDSTVVMRAPYGAGFIEQRYAIQPDSYSVNQTLSLVGLGDAIKRDPHVGVEFDATLPRMEKGYRNETQYSRLNYYFPEDNKPGNIGNGRNGSERFPVPIEWFAFQQQFFSAIMRAPEKFSSAENFSIEFLPKGDKDLMHCNAQLKVDLNTEKTERVDVQFEYYFGPNDYKGLKAYGHAYEKVIPLGGKIIGIFTKWVIIPLFDWLHRFISNFGIIILLMTIFIKIVVLPLAYKSYSSSAKMQALRPFMEKINEKYPKQEDAMKKQQETMALYKRAGVSPMGGCLPMLLQMPILWAMFRFFPASIELRQQPFLWAEDLSAYDDVIHWDFSILGMNHISLFALLMAVSMFFYSKIMQNQTAGNDPNGKMMKTMSLYIMPIMMFFICNNLSAGLSYYYLLSNLITMLETWIIRKWVVDPEKVVARVKESENKPIPKSKWQQRLEEAQKMQRQMQNQKQKRK